MKNYTKTVVFLYVYIYIYIYTYIYIYIYLHIYICISISIYTYVYIYIYIYLHAVAILAQGPWGLAAETCAAIWGQVEDAGAELLTSARPEASSRGGHGSS